MKNIRETRNNLCTVVSQFVKVSGQSGPGFSALPLHHFPPKESRNTQGELI
jgi:hypothetical protein